MICIIGNNLTAKTTFLYLQKSSIPCILIAKDYTQDQYIKYKNSFSSRTMAIAKTNFDIIKNIVNIEKLKDISGEIKKIYIMNSEKSQNPEIIFDSSEYKLDNMGYIVHYNDFCDEIEKEILKYQNDLIIDVDEICKFESGFEIKFKDKVFFVKNLILTDKTLDEKLSFINQKKHFKYNYFESAITLNIKHTLKHNNVAIENFTHLGPLASLPMKSQFESNIVRTVPRKIADAILTMSENDKISFIKENLISNLQIYLGDIEINSQISIFPLKLELNKQSQENVIFFGTYNFAMHPIAGQGFNVILRDIERLKQLSQSNQIENFKSSFSRKLDISSMLLATHNLNQFFKIKNPIISSFRKLGMEIFNKSEILKKFAFKNAIGNGVFNKIS